MEQMNEDRTYNGWTSYETWAVALWLDNEQGSYLYWREQAEEHWINAPESGQVVKGIWTREEAAQFNLADQLRDEIRENSPIQEPSMYSDLLSSALDEVNWKEIAGNWLEDWIEAAEKEEKEAEAEQGKEENDKAEEEKKAGRVAGHFKLHSCPSSSGWCFGGRIQVSRGSGHNLPNRHDGGSVGELCQSPEEGERARRNRAALGYS
jgi:hypothetical protein